MSSSRNYEQKARMVPCVRKIQLINNNNRQSRRKPSKLCPDCKDTNNCVKLLLSKVGRIEEIVDNFYRNLPRQKEFSLYRAKFTVNNVPCELEYDLSNFTLEELVNFTTTHKNDNSPSRKSNIYDLLN